MKGWIGWRHFALRLGEKLVLKPVLHNMYMFGSYFLSIGCAERGVFGMTSLVSLRALSVQYEVSIADLVGLLQEEGVDMMAEVPATTMIGFVMKEDRRQRRVRPLPTLDIVGSFYIRLDNFAINGLVDKGSVKIARPIEIYNYEKGAWKKGDPKRYFLQALFDFMRGKSREKAIAEPGLIFQDTAYHLSESNHDDYDFRFYPIGSVRPESDCAVDVTPDGVWVDKEEASFLFQLVSARED